MSLDYVMIGINDLPKSRAYFYDPDGNRISFKHSEEAA
jgi:hypothetical protein